MKKLWKELKKMQGKYAQEAEFLKEGLEKGGGGNSPDAMLKASMEQEWRTAKGGRAGVRDGGRTTTVAVHNSFAVLDRQEVKESEEAAAEVSVVEGMGGEEREDRTCDAGCGALRCST